MIVNIPKQRQNKNAVHRPFNELVKYMEVFDLQLKLAVGIDPEFSDLIDYSVDSIDELTQADKCIGVRIHGVTSIETAATEMNAVSAQNKRCQDPAFHFILSWPEFEKPDPKSIFDAAEHAIKAMGLGQHQYVIAVHDNTDNRHCHIAVNRVHPVTFKSQHLEWAMKTLHIAARESEIKHGWFHDNGIYVVEVGADGQKQIVLNTRHKDYSQEHSTGKAPELEAVLPTWHDPESLESWLKGHVSKALKRRLSHFESWQGLHAWLERYGITLTNTGGGLRLIVTSYTTGEILDLAASKGLRQLKKADLEKRWGPYEAVIDPQPVKLDTSSLTPEQLSQGALNVIGRNFDGPGPKFDFIHHPQHPARAAAGGAGSVHGLSDSSMDGRGQGAEVLLPDDVSNGLGNNESWQDQALRRAGDGGTSQPVGKRQRNDDAREQRKAERAAARDDLRKRFTLYKKFINEGADDYYDRLRQLRKAQSADISALNQQSRQQKREIKKSSLSASDKLLSVAAIDLEFGKTRVGLEAEYANRFADLRATRPPALGWREWLHEQSNLGDQAAVSALRGIVYQSRRDAKNEGLEPAEELDEERAAKDEEYRALQHQKTVARLLDEERQEIAIRAARSYRMRPHELDALLIRYAGIQWHVTGNGNIEYRNKEDRHLFTDRGNRITFDKVFVTDDEIRLALLHSRQKFGNCITLSGQDPVFTQRMALLADEIGLTVLNPEVSVAITNGRRERLSRRAATAEPLAPEQTVQNPIQEALQTSFDPDVVEGAQAALKARVLSIDPRASFVETFDNNGREYVGPVIAIQQDGEGTYFAQHIGRSHYVLHSANHTDVREGASLTIRYENGTAIATATPHSQVKDR